MKKMGRYISAQKVPRVQIVAILQTDSSQPQF